MIKIQEHKTPQHDMASEKYLSPKRLYLPLSQHTGSPSSPCIKKGDSVKEGELIAEMTAFISASLHAPTNGKILNIDNWPHPNLKRSLGITIQCDNHKQEYRAQRNFSLLKKDDLLGIIKKNGIVGMGGAAFPTHVKLNPPKKIDTLIINGCECEPYLATDCRLMIENISEIFQGVEIISKLTNPGHIIFAVEENKPEAIKNINLLIGTEKFALPKISLLTLPSAYPQGGEKQLIYSATKRKVSSTMLPFDVGCLVHNVATIFAIYEAVYFNKPLIERLVSFCGDALIKPKNLWVKIGTTLKELFDEKILEFKAEPEKIICGGPMMGIALDSLDYPVLKSNGGFLFLSKETGLGRENPCIRCGACVRECPVQIMPCLINLASEKWLWEEAKSYSPLDCIECGICSYVCPANRRLVQSIKRVKLELKR